jgi:hypothetical protein
MSKRLLQSVAVFVAFVRGSRPPVCRDERAIRWDLLRHVRTAIVMTAFRRGEAWAYGLCLLAT